MDNQLSKEDQAAVEAAIKELQEVCTKHGVEVIAYIHALGPRIQVVKVPENKEPQNEAPGNDAKTGERVPKADK